MKTNSGAGQGYTTWYLELNNDQWDDSHFDLGAKSKDWMAFLGESTSEKLVALFSRAEQEQVKDLLVAMHENKNSPKTFFEALFSLRGLLLTQHLHVLDLKEVPDAQGRLDSALALVCFGDHVVRLFDYADLSTECQTLKRLSDQNIESRQDEDWLDKIAIDASRNDFVVHTPNEGFELFPNAEFAEASEKLLMKAIGASSARAPYLAMAVTQNAILNMQGLYPELLPFGSHKSSQFCIEQLPSGLTVSQVAFSCVFKETEMQEALDDLKASRQAANLKTITDFKVVADFLVSNNAIYCLSVGVQHLDKTGAVIQEPVESVSAKMGPAFLSRFSRRP